jgi:hypothetical protein
MRRFAERTIAALFRACRRGAAFNLMTTRVDYRDAALFYRNPAEVLAHCLALTPHVRLDHARGLFEYTVYLYRNPRCG